MAQEAGLRGCNPLPQGWRRRNSFTWVSETIVVPKDPAAPRLTRVLTRAAMGVAIDP